LKKSRDVVDEIVFAKNQLTEGLSSDEKKEVDMYFEEIIKEFEPMIEIFDKILSEEKILQNITNIIKEHASEEKWSEKMSDMFKELE